VLERPGKKKQDSNLSGSQTKIAKENTVIPLKTFSEPKTSSYEKKQSETINTDILLTPVITKNTQNSEAIHNYENVILGQQSEEPIDTKFPQIHIFNNIKTLPGGKARAIPENISTYRSKKENSSLPNLIAYDPKEWDDAIVISNKIETHTDDTIVEDQSSYIDFAFVNLTQLDIEETFSITMNINGEDLKNWTKKGLAKMTYFPIEDIKVNFNDEGTYTIKFILDIENVVQESNENDNAYSKKLTVISSSKANLSPYQPKDWDDIT